jgi:TatD DNase family protein
MKWIDVHTHLNMLEADAEAVLAAAAKEGVERMITIGTGADDHAKVVAYTEKFSPVVCGALGYHPHDAKDYTPEAETYMRAHLNDAGIVAVGEIGLDYYYNHSPHDVQRDVFRRQMALAEEFKLPVEIHTRDAEADTVEILKEFKGRVKGLLHCFTGTQWLADEALAIDYNISISGVVTFKTAEALRAVVKTVPLDRLHIETDAPFLTPVPFRGKKNEPAFLVHTAQVVADLKGVTIEELARATGENARKLFPRLKWS